ncbi:MAG: D-alanyl-D-alanine carboxypeptidase/D-alanyl-D-alanine-endopeptidase [Pseudomonadota bacterium]
MAFLLYGVASPALAQAPTVSLRPTLKPADAVKATATPAGRLVEKAALGGQVSFAVADAVTGEMLETRTPLTPHPPASVVKAITTLFALKTLGPGHRFRTCVMATGPMENGVVKGDLVLTGTGDPTLDTDDLFAMAKQLKEIGLREVTGSFQYYDAALPHVAQIDAGQPEHLGYNPAIGGLNLNFNRIYLEWKRQADAYRVVMEARALTVRPGVTVAATRVVDRRAPVFDYKFEAGREVWSVARGALGKEGGRWLPTRAPGPYAADVFRTLARSTGLQLGTPVALDAKPTGKLLVEHVSEDLAQICRGMLRYSTNLTAEVVGLSASQDINANPSDLPASGAAMSDWLSAEYGLNKAALIDHSGLGDGSRLSAQEMVKILVGDGPQGLLRGLLKPFAIKGPDGGISINGPVQVAAKTGTLNFVSGLGGFIKTASGRTLAFAIFTSDMPRRETLTKAQRERPRGGRAWAGRARTLQRDLIDRWATIYDGSKQG